MMTAGNYAMHPSVDCILNFLGAATVGTCGAFLGDSWNQLWPAEEHPRVPAPITTGKLFEVHILYLLDSFRAVSAFFLYRDIFLPDHVVQIALYACDAHPSDHLVPVAVNWFQSWLSHMPHLSHAHEVMYNDYVNMGYRHFYVQLVSAKGHVLTTERMPNDLISIQSPSTNWLVDHGKMRLSLEGPDVLRHNPPLETFAIDIPGSRWCGFSKLHEVVRLTKKHSLVPLDSWPAGRTWAVDVARHFAGSAVKDRFGGSLLHYWSFAINSMMHHPGGTGLLTVFDFGQHFPSRLYLELSLASGLDLFKYFVWVVSFALPSGINHHALYWEMDPETDEDYEAPGLPPHIAEQYGVA